jgi:RNA polymerase sigma-70 factor, ECF subfamily
MRQRHIDRVRRFYQNNRQELYVYAFSICRDPDLAEDSIQTAFFGLLRRRSLPRDLRPFVFRSIRNAIIDVRRADRIRNNNNDSAPEVTLGENGPVRDRTLNQCLELLNDHQRETIVLKAFVGLTFAEIGRVLNESANTIASRYRRGLERMREVLEDQT